MSNNKQIQLLDGYWVIGTNKWDAKIYTEEEAVKYADTLINCHNCSDCSSCSFCHYCRDCSSCIFCRVCSDCSDCSVCHNCSVCSDCSDCSSCSFCHNCHNCSDCSDCSDFKENPERITSPLLGSRNSQTTFYWNDKKEQIVCGCFQGNLEEFEMKIKEMHGENKYAQGYLKWIEKIKIYRQ
jgi:hypothetical protein